MSILERQTFVITYNFAAANATAKVQIPMNLRFAAEELIVKSILYSPTGGNDGNYELIQVWCNLTNDNLIGLMWVLE